MCGIFGIVNRQGSSLSIRDFRKVTDKLFLLSETRGKEASGLVLLPSVESDTVFVIKSPGTASALIRDKAYRQFVGGEAWGCAKAMNGFAFGHTRLVTNGSQLDAANNQPVVCNGAVAVHNGIVVNEEALWHEHQEIKRHSQVDTELILSLLCSHYGESLSASDATRKVFSQIKGTASCAFFLPDTDTVVLATNHGSLYVAVDDAAGPLVFASEKHTLSMLLQSSAGASLRHCNIQHVEPNHGFVLCLSAPAGHDIIPFSFADGNVADARAVSAPARTTDVRVIGSPSMSHSVVQVRHTTVPPDVEADADRTRAAVLGLRRCTKCILPETVPFIEFDEQGVCNFCRHHRPVELLGREALEKAIAPYRRGGGTSDCVCSISGGRDSCFGLHYVVKELGMKPTAYTYDWGMVTDIARRNISRMCSALGVEHILISANIPRKRAYIRKNIAAWLNKPHLGMVPLFMAGDKQFVWYANRVKRQLGVELDFFTFNLFEKTQFKEEFTGIQLWRPGEDADKLGEELGIWRGVQLGTFYARQFLTNPGYLNTSLLDTFYGFITYYCLPRTFVALFRHIPWREDLVVDTLLEEYDWELATDTKATWRIGDGTAPFYNYIYYMLAGFTEHDTLRAGQVREGHMSREEAMHRVLEDNRPRWDSMKWYCDIVGLDFLRTIRRINGMRPAAAQLTR